MNLKKLFLAVGFSSGMAGVASAATATASMTTTINVTSGAAASTCTWQAPVSPSLTYAQNSATDVSSTFLLYISCTPSVGAPPSVVVSVGAGMNSTPMYRRAAGVGGYINYQIRDTAGGLIFDDQTVPAFGSAGTTVAPIVLIGAGVGSLAGQVRIPAGQTVATGNYSDTVTLTATY